MNPLLQIILSNFPEFCTAFLVLLAAYAFVRTEVRDTMLWRSFLFGIFLLSVSSIATIAEGFIFPEALNSLEHICNMAAGLLFGWNIYLRLCQPDDSKRSALYEL